MAKDNYTDTSIKDKYKALIKKPTSALPKITVDSTEKRTRAELLDMIEELFTSSKDTANSLNELNPPINNENLRAIFHILTKSIHNTEDDGTTITTAQSNAITTNTAKVGQNLTTANHTLEFQVTNTRGRYTLDIIVVDNSGRSAVTKTASITLN